MLSFNISTISFNYDIRVSPKKANYLFDGKDGICLKSYQDSDNLIAILLRRKLFGKAKSEYRENVKEKFNDSRNESDHAAGMQ
jgi:hypothetical protein